MPPKYYIMVVGSMLGFSVSLMLWLWHWRLTRRADALRLYASQVVMLLVACCFLVRPPILSHDIGERLYSSLMPAFGLWAFVPLLIERRILRWALDPSRHQTSAPSVTGNWRDVAFLYMLAVLGAACVFILDSRLVKILPPGAIPR